MRSSSRTSYIYILTFSAIAVGVLGYRFAPDIQAFQSTPPAGASLLKAANTRGTSGARVFDSHTRARDEPQFYATRVSFQRDELASKAVKPDPIQEQSRLAQKAYAEAEQLRVEDKTDSSIKAIEKYEEARERWHAARDGRAEASTLRSMGQVYQSLNEAQKALVNYNQALALSQGLKDLRGQCNILNDIAYLQITWGENKKALANATKALNLSRNTGHSPGEAQALHLIGDSYYGLGDLKKSVEYYQQALQLWRRLDDSRKQAQVLVSFGYAYVDLSDIQKALDCYNEALSLSRASNDRNTTALALRALGNLQTKLGENQQALDSFHKTLEILQTLDNRLLKATVLAGLGYVYDGLGEKRRAIEYFDQAIEIFRGINNRWGEAEALMDAGKAYYSLGEYKKALDNYRSALSLFSALAMPRYVAQTLADTGLIYDSLGDKAKALSCYRRSLNLTRNGQDQRYEAYTLNYIGRLYESLSDRQKARGYYRRALQLNTVAVDRLGESLTRYNLADFERDSGNLTASRAQIEQALEIVESLRTKVASRNLRIAYFASAHRYYELYIDILMRLHKESPHRGFDAIALDASERARGRSLLDMLEEAHADISQGVDPALLQRKRLLQRTLQGKTERRMQLLAGQYSKEEAAALANEIDEITTNFDEVERQIKAISPHYAALTQIRPLSLKEIQGQAIDDDTLMLEYSLGEERSYLWAITKAGLRSYDLPARAEVEALASRVREALIAPRFIDGESLQERQARLQESELTYRQAVSALSNILLGQAAGQLGTKRLIVIADGALHYIPFSALPEPGQGFDDPPPLVLRHEITYQFSASALAVLRDKTGNRQPASKVLAVFADPVFEQDDPRLGAGKETITAPSSEQSDGTQVRRALRGVGVLGSGEHIPRLFASRDEAEAVMAVTPSGLGLKATGFEASKTAVTGADLRQYRIIHFATHGVLNSENPDLSGLVLSLFDKQGQPQDGFLRLNDIYNLELPADLVVLSACNTGLGKQIKGEGLIGLTRGFMYAGAARVMASLWKVDDEATAQLIKYFYQEMLVEKKSPAEALRQAQIAMWNHKRWHAPYFWAAFVLQGEYKGEIDANVQAKRDTSKLFIPGVLVTLFFCAGIYAARQLRLKKRQGRPSR
jgi:CHAT domain-containing protein/tetratricopeptide (TPR) repeat protein